VSVQLDGNGLVLQAEPWWEIFQLMTPHTDQEVGLPRVGMAVFFTRGMSLEAWDKAGLLEREMAFYCRLSKQIGRICFVTYGDSTESRYCKDLSSIEILSNRWSLPPNVYSVLAPYLHRAALRNISIFKTNQINGGWCALVAKVLFGGKLLVRCGYIWSEFVERLGAGYVRRWLSTSLERVVLRSADAIIVSSSEDAREVERRHLLTARSITTIGNYVDLERFKPSQSLTSKPGRLVFVGRLEEQKNPMALLNALVGLESVHLTVVGDGSLRSQLEHEVTRLNLSVDFLGTVAHEQLPDLLIQNEALVMPSIYEGTPKALLEAMACGVPVIATKSPGITGVVTHNRNGYLCGLSIEEIRGAIQVVLEDVVLRERLGQEAVRYIRKHHSLREAVEREIAIIGKLCSSAETV